jgi:hypothetical protein
MPHPRQITALPVGLRESGGYPDTGSEERITHRETRINRVSQDYFKIVLGFYLRIQFYIRERKR